MCTPPFCRIQHPETMGPCIPDQTLSGTQSPAVTIPINEVQYHQEAMQQSHHSTRHSPFSSEQGIPANCPYSKCFEKTQKFSKMQNISINTHWIKESFYVAKVTIWVHYKRGKTYFLLTIQSWLMSRKLCHYTGQKATTHCVKGIKTKHCFSVTLWELTNQQKMTYHHILGCKKQSQAWLVHGFINSVLSQLLPKLFHCPVFSPLEGTVS